MSNVTPLRRPTGIVPWPLVLLEGAEKTGKTYESLKFSGDERIAKTYALDLGEGSLDEYRDIPGADFWVVDHDGTWRQIIERLTWLVETEAPAVVAEGGVPLLVVDTGTAEWDMLKSWVDARARRQDHNVRKLARDPDAEIKATRNLWNDADARHARFMSLLRRFPGPVVVTARGKWVSATGKDGQPIENEKEYRVEGHKGLGFAANAWVRLSRDAPPTVIGMRHVRWGIRPGIDEPQPVPDFSLGWLIFDVMGCAAGTSTIRDQADLDADQIMPDEEVTDPEQDVAKQAQQQQDQRTGRQRQAAGQAPVPAAQRAAKAVEYVLGAADVDAAGKRQAWAERQGVVSRSDVGGLLTERDREELSIAKGQKVTLVDLAAAMCTYVGSNKRAVRPAAPAAPSLAEAANNAAAVADELGRQTIHPDGTTQAELDEYLREAREIQREAVA